MPLRKWGFSADFAAIGAVALAAALLGSPSACAGVFDIPRFVEPGRFALGVEPELVMSPSAGLGVNAKFTEGVSDQVNVQGILGTGGGPRKFRIGGNMVFDFVPDIDRQPGIGLAAQGLYYRVPDAGRLELTGIPYIHKAFKQTGGWDIDPFLSFPTGFAFSDSTYLLISQLVIGTLFQQSEHVGFSAELGLNLDHSESYFSGGLIYYY